LEEFLLWPFRRKSTTGTFATKAEPRPEIASKPVSETGSAPGDLPAFFEKHKEDAATATANNPPSSSIEAAPQTQTIVPAPSATQSSFRLFAEVVKTDSSPNLFLSPASVMMCLGMAREIASGETRQQMGKVLALDELAPEDTDKVLASLKWVFRRRISGSPSYVTLLSANSL
jgi:serine protease inhibitor